MSNILKKQDDSLKVLSNEWLDDFIESVQKAFESERKFTDEEYKELKELFEWKTPFLAHFNTSLHVIMEELGIKEN